MTEAETKLATLEKPGHDLDAARMALRNAEVVGDKEKITQARAHFSDAQTAFTAHAAQFDAAGGLDRVVAEHAQFVLDERGEGHTETALLDEDAGAAVMKAQTDLALAIADGNKKRVTAAQEAFNEAKAGHKAVQNEGDANA